MPASPLPNVKVKFWNRAGAPLAGGKVYTYVAGSVSTNKTTWKDYNKVTANTNPVILDAYGEADIWLDGNYKINLEDSAGVAQWGAPIDNVTSISQLNTVLTSTGSSNAYVLSPSPAITAYAGGIFTFIPNFTNTGPATINISGLGASALEKFGSNALVSGDIVSGTIVTIYYDGTNFQVANPVVFPSGSAAATSVSVGTVGNGLFSSAANTVNIATNGVSVGYFSSTGNFVIGEQNLNGYRYSDIINRDTTIGAGGQNRIITKNVSGVGDSVFYILKTNLGLVEFNNTETNSAANYQFTLGSLSGVNALQLSNAGSGINQITVGGTNSTDGANCHNYVMQGKDGAGNVHSYAQISGTIVSNVDGSEDGAVTIYTSKASIMTEVLKVGFNSSGVGFITASEQITASKGMLGLSTVAQTYTNGTAGAVAHTLGRRPFLAIPRFKCVIAEGDYAVGDEFDLQNCTSTLINGGFTVFYTDTTNIRFRASSDGVVQTRKTSAQNFTLTPANWTVSFNLL